MTYESLLKTGRLGININGDFEDKILIEKAVKAEKHVKAVWIGDSDFFKDPFHVAKLVLENADLIVGFGILREKNCSIAIKKLEEFSNYEDRVIVGISAGDGGRLKDAARCIEALKKSFDFPVVAGGTGRKSISMLSEIADGILLNHISPHHVEYALKYVKSDFVAAYGPCLILPSPFEQDLLLATAMIMGSSRSFLEDMGYWEIYREISKTDVINLIAKRQKGMDLRGLREYRHIENYKDFLLENFSLAGIMDEISAKIEKLLEMCDHVILSDPFFRDENFDKKIKEIVENLKKKI